VIRRRHTTFAQASLREQVRGWPKPGRLALIAVTDALDVANPFGFLGYRDTAKFLMEYVPFFLPTEGVFGMLGSLAFAVYLPVGTTPGAEAIAEDMRHEALVRTLDLGDDHGIYLHLEASFVPYSGGYLDADLSDAVGYWNAAREWHGGKRLDIRPSDWEPVFEAEFLRD
jgi:hypothetical protein